MNWLAFASYPGLIISQKHSVKRKMPTDTRKYLLSTYYAPGNFLEAGSVV